MLVIYVVTGAFAIISLAMCDRPGNIRVSMSVVEEHTQAEEVILRAAATPPSGVIGAARVKSALTAADRPPGLMDLAGNFLRGHFLPAKGTHALADDTSFGDQPSQEVQPTESSVSKGRELFVSTNGALLYQILRESLQDNSTFRIVPIGTVRKHTLVIAAGEHDKDSRLLPVEAGFFYQTFEFSIVESTGVLAMDHRFLHQADNNSTRLAHAVREEMVTAKQLADKRAKITVAHEADDISE